MGLFIPLQVQQNSKRCMNSGSAAPDTGVNPVS